LQQEAKPLKAPTHGALELNEDQRFLRSLQECRANPDVDRLDRLLAAGVAQAQDQRELGTYKNLRMSQTMLLERWKLWKFL
jgi:hypothetical protein